MSKEKIKEIESKLKRALMRVENSFIATVIKDKEFTADVKDLAGTTFLDVRKIATDGTNGVLFSLKENSFVLVTRIANSDDLFVSMMSEVTGMFLKCGTTSVKMNNAGEIILNDGQFGGLIIRDKLAIEISKLNAAIATLKTATNTALVAVDAIIPGTSAIYATATAGIQQANLSGVTNDKIKH